MKQKRIAIDEEQEERAVELEGMRSFTKAERVRVCGAEGGIQLRSCKLRDCPRCARWLSLGYRIRAARAIARMTRPRLCLATLCSKGLADLEASMKGFRLDLRKIRRRTVFRPVLAGVGGLEPKLADGRMRWVVHSHLVLDLTVGFDIQRAEAEWLDITEGWGSFSLNPGRPEVEAWNVERVANYVTKPRDWCPEPGTMDLIRHRILRAALRNKQLLICWPKDRAAQALARV